MALLAVLRAATVQLPLLPHPLPPLQQQQQRQRALRPRARRQQQRRLASWHCGAACWQRWRRWGWALMRRGSRLWMESWCLWCCARWGRLMQVGVRVQVVLPAVVALHSLHVCQAAQLLLVTRSCCTRRVCYAQA
jgi:hypothetical protein